MRVWKYSRRARSLACAWRMRPICETSKTWRAGMQTTALKAFPRRDAEDGRDEPTEHRQDVSQQLKNDLALEKSAVAAYNRAIETCRKAGDNATADFFKEILKDEEEHVG